MPYEVEASVLNDTFQRNKLFNVMRHLKISRASLLIDGDNVEFIANGDEDEFKLFRAGETPVTYKEEQVQNRCPVCGSLVCGTVYTEEVVDNNVEDYQCRSCGFKGSQWILQVFIGHTSADPNQNIESFKEQRKI